MGPEQLKDNNDSVRDDMNFQSLTELESSFDQETAQRTQKAREIFRYDSDFSVTMAENEWGFNSLRDNYDNGIKEMGRVLAAVKGTGYAEIFATKRGNLTMQEHTIRMLNVFDTTYAKSFQNAGVDIVSSVVREALKVRDIYRFKGPAQADGLMREADRGMIMPDGRSYVMDVLSGETMARNAFGENASKEKQEEFREWGRQIDEKYGVSGRENSPTANLAKIISDVVKKASETEK